MNNKLRDNFIKDCIKKDIQFELVGEFSNRSTKTLFRCKKCGDLKEYIPHNIIINGAQCTNCGNKKRISFDQLKEKISEKGYSLISSEEEICGKSGKFSVNLDGSFLCPKCNKIFRKRISKILYENSQCTFCKTNRKLTDEEVQAKLDSLYNYQFKLVSKYDGRKKKITVKCKFCEKETTDFAYNFFTNKRMCKFCTSSRMEREIKSKFNENIVQNVKKNGLKYIEPLFIDFFYPKNNLYIECDGIQHFEPIEYYGGKDRFILDNKRDILKNNYAKKNNLTLIRFFNESLDVDCIIDFLNSTTIEEFAKYSEDLLVIKDGEIKLQTGKYLTIQVE